VSRGRGGGTRNKKFRSANDDGEADLVTPSRRDDEDAPQSRSSLRDPAVRDEVDEAVTATLSHEHINATIFLMYKTAQKKLTNLGRERFSTSDIESLL
jgi:hypothetical protein